MQLSPIDASPLLLKTLNSPALKFDHDLDPARLQQATAALLLEYPIIGGRYGTLCRSFLRKYSWTPQATVVGVHVYDLLALLFKRLSCHSLANIHWMMPLGVHVLAITPQRCFHSCCLLALCVEWRHTCMPTAICRIKKLSKQDISSQPWLKAAPYCIDLAATNANVLLVEASAAAAASAISLNGALTAPFSMTSSKVQLPPWHQVGTASRPLSRQVMQQRCTTCYLWYACCMFETRRVICLPHVGRHRR
jgi:hypothetical protein